MEFTVCFGFPLQFTVCSGFPLKFTICFRFPNFTICSGLLLKCTICFGFPLTFAVCTEFPRKFAVCSGKIHVSHFLVYMLTCLVDGMRKTYIGMTGVLVGQSDDAALLVRRRFHVSCQKTWLQGMSVSTLRLRKLLSNLSEANAHVEEPRHTAQVLNSVEDFGTIRGGPWCRKVWTHDDRLEVEEVRGCKSRSQVREA